MQIDHIEPVIPVSGFPLTPEGKEDWNVYIERMFCTIDKLQKLCKPCHLVKSVGENKERKEIKKSKRKKKV